MEEQFRKVFFEQLAALKAFAEAVEKLGELAFPVDSALVPGKEGSYGKVKACPKISLKCTVSNHGGVGSRAWSGYMNLEGPEILK